MQHVSLAEYMLIYHSMIYLANAEKENWWFSNICINYV